MRRINPEDFRVARRGTSREINRQIALTLIRTKQPISRADLARLMNVRRGGVSLLVNELIQSGLVFEGAKGEIARGRKPKFLYLDSRERCVLAVDIRPTRTYLTAMDLVGHQLVGIDSYPTETNPLRFISALSKRIKRLLVSQKELGSCQGVGVVVPGMVDRLGSRVVFSPLLGWRGVQLREPLALETGLEVHIENSGKACALAQMWAVRADQGAIGDLVFVSVSDGLGAGIVSNGELLRGRHNIAGEFGHVPLSIDGPRCACGATGCWEAYVSNLATVSRYFGRSLSEGRALPAAIATLSVDDLIARARAGDGKAVAALHSTARYLGLGLATIVNSIDPARIYIGGEITGAWDLIESTVRGALEERVLEPAANDLKLAIVPAEDSSRLKGAAALVAGRAFAAPIVA